MPGPPRGPSLRITTHVAGTDGLAPRPPPWRPPRTRRRAPGRVWRRRSWPGDLDHAALGGQVAAQDRQAAVRLERRVERPDHLLAGRLDRARGLLGDRASRDGHRVAVQMAALEQPPARPAARRRHGTRSVGDEAPAGLEVADDRRRRRDAVEVVDLERHAGFARDRQQVQHAVGRAAAAPPRPRSRSRAPARVMISLGRCPRASTSMISSPTSTRDVALAAVLGRHHGRAHRRDAEELERHRHGVGRELAAARAGARADAARSSSRKLVVGHACPRRARRRPRRRPGW